MIQEHRPRALALEEIFLAANVHTAFTLGQVRGVVLLAAAQASSVTIFGVLDVGVQRLKNGSKTLNLESIDGMQTSHFVKGMHATLTVG